MNQYKDKNQNKSCYQCEGKGYTEIRDCAGEIQRTETCSYCEGRGNNSIISEKVNFRQQIRLIHLEHIKIE